MSPPLLRPAIMASDYTPSTAPSLSIMDRASATADAAGPSTRHPESAYLLATWSDCRTALLGTRAMQAAITRYLPAHPREKATDYNRRAAYTAFYNAFGRTVRGIAGLPFRQAPTYGENIPQVVRDHVENIDGEGTHLDIFARRLFEDGLTTGTAGVLIDVPPAEPGLSKLQEEQRGIRPYWLPIAAEDVITWRSARVGGRRVLTLLVVREHTEQDQPDEFLIVPQTRYLVYRRTTDPVTLAEMDTPVTVQRYVEVARKDGREIDVVPLDTAPLPVRNVSRIPYVPLLLGLRTSECTAVTPLLDLLDMNLQHFRVSSDRNWLMHLSCVPVPVKKGQMVNPAKTADSSAAPRTEAWGANVLMRVPADGDFYYREPSGSAFDPTGKELDKLEQRMAALGLAFLASDTRAAETAEAKRLDAAVQNATLAACADALDDCIEQALAIHAEFCKVAKVGSGGEISGGEWSTSRDYEQQVMSPQMLDTYARLEANGQLSLATFWKILTKLGALPEDFDADAEQKALDTVPTVTAPSPFGVPPLPDDEDEEEEDGIDDDTEDDAEEEDVPPPPSRRRAARG